MTLLVSAKIWMDHLKKYKKLINIPQIQANMKVQTEMHIWMDLHRFMKKLFKNLKEKYESISVN